VSLVTFVLGGARSGKSRYAEGIAAKHNGRKTYIATADPIDAEMRARIAEHRERRGNDWETLEAPVDLVAALRGCKTDFVLIDCITVWIGNLMHHKRDVRAEVEKLREALSAAKGRVVVVSNEVGLAIVPDNALARAFRDEQGFANQCIAEAAGEVIFVMASLPMVLKKPQRKPTPRVKAKSSHGRRA